MHICKYRRSDTALALARPDLEATLGHVVESIEAKMFPSCDPEQSSKMNPGTEESAMGYCELESKTGASDSSPLLFSIIPRLPFRKEYMTNITGDAPAYATVEPGLSPILCKLIPGDSEPTPVRRALIQVTKGPSVTIDGSEYRMSTKRERECNVSS
jgi:hypothetical protein